MSLPSRPWHLLFFHWGKSTEITTRPGNTRHLKPYPSAPVSSLGGRRPRPVRFWNTNGAHKVDCESHGNWLGISFWWKKNIFQDFIRFQDLEIRLNKKKTTHLKLFLKYVKLSWADPHSGSKPLPSLGGLEIRWSLRELSPELRWWMQSYHTVDGRNPANHLRCFFNPGILMVDSPNTGEFTGFLKHESTIFPMISKVTLLFSVCPGKSYSHEKNSAESLNLMVLFVMTRYDSLHLDESKKHTPLSHHSVTLRFRETCSPTRWCNMCDLFIPDRETGHDSPLKRVRWVR